MLPQQRNHRLLGGYTLIQFLARTAGFLDIPVVATHSALRGNEHDAFFLRIHDTGSMTPTQWLGLDEIKLMGQTHGVAFLWP